MKQFMRYILVFAFSIGLTGCASHGNSGVYNRDTKDTYSLQVGGAVKDPEYTFQRGSYEICKSKNKSGVEILEKSWKSYGQGSWIEGRIKCTGPADSYLESKFKDNSDQYSEEPSSVGGFEKEFSLAPLNP